MVPAHSRGSGNPDIFRNELGPRLRGDERKYASELALDDIHHDVAQSIDREHRPLAWRNGNRRNETAGDHDHIGFEIAAALGDMIGEPGQSGARILRGTFADRLAAEREPAGNSDKISERRAFRRSGNDPAIPAIVHDQRQSLGRRIIGVAVLDQFESGQSRGDSRRDPFARPRRAGRPLARFRFRYAD